MASPQILGVPLPVSAAVGAAAALAAATSTWQYCSSGGATGAVEQAAAAQHAKTTEGSGGTQLRVVLYYKYRELEDVAVQCQWQRALCERLRLTGRIRVATEGINGTLCGTATALDQYVRQMEATGWSNIDWKFSDAALDGPLPFASLVVAEKAEIISLAGAEKGSLALAKLQADAPVGSGDHLSPTEWREHLQAARATAASDTIILDVRNGYESKIGAFDGAIRPDIRQFSELPRWLDSHTEVTAGKTVLLYCTGGIRCERAAGLLEKRGKATRTLQLAGGIHRYLESYPDGGELWQGANLVFDQRHVQHTSPPTSAPGGSASCAACAIETDSYLAESRCIRCRALLLLCRECVRRAELATPSEGRITVNYSGFVQRKLESWENGLPLLCALCDTREQSGELKKPLTRTMASKPVFIEGKGWAVDE